MVKTFVKTMLAGMIPTALLIGFMAAGTVYVNPAFPLMVVAVVCGILGFGFFSYLLGLLVLQTLRLFRGD